MGLRDNFLRRARWGEAYEKILCILFVLLEVHVDTFWGFLIDFKVTRTPDVGIMDISC
jgi:hypothetical protein